MKKKIQIQELESQFFLKGAENLIKPTNRFVLSNKAIGSQF
jgi:hypothetical protein